MASLNVSITTTEVSFEDAPLRNPKHCIRWCMIREVSCRSLLRAFVAVPPDQWMEADSSRLHQTMASVASKGLTTQEEADAMNKTIRQNIRKTMDKI